MMDNVLSLINELSKELDAEFQKILEKTGMHCSLFLFEKYQTQQVF